MKLLETELSLWLPPLCQTRVGWDSELKTPHDRDRPTSWTSRTTSILGRILCYCSAFLIQLAPEVGFQINEYSISDPSEASPTAAGCKHISPANSGPPNCCWAATFNQMLWCRAHLASDVCDACGTKELLWAAAALGLTTLFQAFLLSRKQSHSHTSKLQAYHSSFKHQHSHSAESPRPYSKTIEK